MFSGESIGLAVAKKRAAFNPTTFLATIGEDRTSLILPKKQTIFVPGRCLRCSVLYPERKCQARCRVQDRQGSHHRNIEGGVFVVRAAPGGQIVRWGLRLQRQIVSSCASRRRGDALHREHAFPDLFTAFLRTRNIRYEENLVDQLLNSSEKMLARVLLILARFGKEGAPESAIPKRSIRRLWQKWSGQHARESAFFMNRFRKLGFINYAGGEEGRLQVHSSLLNIVLHD